MKLGFTLVELIASFAIIVIIALGVFIQFRQLSPSQSVENAADVMRSIFIEARSQARAGTAPVGYGVYVVLDGLPDNTIILFIENDGDYLYTAADTLLTTTILDDDISLTSCDDGAVVTTSGSCTVVFPAYGLDGVYYNGAVSTSKGIAYTFTEPASSTTQAIVLYPATAVIE